MTCVSLTYFIFYETVSISSVDNAKLTRQVRAEMLDKVEHQLILGSEYGKCTKDFKVQNLPCHINQRLVIRFPKYL